MGEEEVVAVLRKRTVGGDDGEREAPPLGRGLK